jgi:hypothetical protein
MDIADWKYTAIGVIFVVSGIGFLVPTFYNMRDTDTQKKSSIDYIKSYLKYTLRGFSAGVILSVALMHLLVEAWYTYAELCEGEAHEEAHPTNGTELLGNSTRRYLEEAHMEADSDHGHHEHPFPGK